MGTLRFDVEKLQWDIAERGWMATDLARESGVSHMTVSRFLSGEIQTPRTAAKFAAALGKTVRRYLVRGEAA
jgi:transcriptional regulator with XRE-family HTH domain